MAECISHNVKNAALMIVFSPHYIVAHSVLETDKVRRKFYCFLFYSNNNGGSLNDLRLN